MVLKPYLYENTWVFDDETTGLVREAFVCGIPEIFETLLPAQGIPVAEAAKGFTLLFGSEPFPSAQLKGIWDGMEHNGNWYRVKSMYDANKNEVQEAVGLRGWLCPALFHYFKEAPKTIYINVARK